MNTSFFWKIYAQFRNISALLFQLSYDISYKCLGWEGWPTEPWAVDNNGAVDDENEYDTVSPTSKPQLADDGSERSILAVIDTFDHPLYLLGDTALQLHFVNFTISMQH